MRKNNDPFKGTIYMFCGFYIYDGIFQKSYLHSYYGVLGDRKKLRYRFLKFKELKYLLRNEGIKDWEMIKDEFGIKINGGGSSSGYCNYEPRAVCKWMNNYF